MSEAIGRIVVLSFALMAALPAAAFEQSSAVMVRAADGSNLGLLRQLSNYPLYELRYEAPYHVGVLPISPVYPASSVQAERAFACTCFSAIAASGNRVMGRNYDWSDHPVLVLITKPAGGYASVSVLDMSFLGYSSENDPLRHPARLVDAPSLPCDGMNERGLAVGMMAVDEAKSPNGPGMPVIGALGLMRVLLDNAATLEEALALMGKYYVAFGQGTPIHYFVADRSGASAVVEYFKRQLRVFRAERPWQVSTNFIFAQTSEVVGRALCWRYARATDRLSKTDGRLDPTGIFGLLEAVSQPSTGWSSSYDLTEASLELALGRKYATTYRWTLPAAGRAVSQKHSSTGSRMKSPCRWGTCRLSLRRYRNGSQWQSRGRRSTTRRSSTSIPRPPLSWFAISTTISRERRGLWPGSRTRVSHSPSI